MNRFLRLPNDLVPLVLIGMWLLTLLGLSTRLPDEPASWLTFVALLITPGYLLSELLTRAEPLDLVERLAVALPLGITVLAVPGLITLINHGTVATLALGWQLSSGLVVAVWVVQRLVRPTWVAGERWLGVHQIAIGVLVVLFIAVLPTITLHKIDGDAYAVSTFTADALAGLPLHAQEPLFGTGLGPGVRMLFNQSLPVSYLWSALSGVDPITLTASLSRGPFALWILLAAYALGYAATGARRTALLVFSFQFLIFLSAPFLRGDNISLFFFERTDADKFLVPMALLPVVVALTLRYVRSRQRGYWLAAAVATLAVSAIHPLIAAMLALALSAFAALHLLLAGWTALSRVAPVGALVALVMLLPLIQLLLARGEQPLAPSYPSSFDGWALSEQRVPVLPGIEVATLDLAGSTPSLSTLQPEDALGPSSPLLQWRFDVNLERRRLLIFDQAFYISDPNLLFEPPYLLAVLLLPALFLWRRRTLGAQYAIATTLAILFVMFNPLVTPLIGGLVMPWILWRFIWLLPTALIFALAWEGVVVAMMRRWPPPRRAALIRPVVPLLGVVLVAMLLTPLITYNLEALQERSAAPDLFPAPVTLFEQLEQALGDEGAVVMADPEISVTLPAYVANAAIVAHRVPTTSEIFPADQQPLALQRLIDQDVFYRANWLTAQTLEILNRYEVEYVVLASGSSLENQFRLAPEAFEWLLDNSGYTLYRVATLPAMDSPLIRGNTAMAEQRWTDAEASYLDALNQDSSNLLAQLGLVEINRLNGRFSQATDRLAALARRHDLAPLHARLGQLHSERGNLVAAVEAYQAAQHAAPDVPHYHVMLGNACLRVGDMECTTTQFREAVTDQQPRDPAVALIAEGALWGAQSEWPPAVTRFEAAIALNGSEYNQFMLVNALQEVGRVQEASEILAAQRRRNPLSTTSRVAQAALLAQQGEVDRALEEYDGVLRLQRLLGQSPLQTYQAITQTLLDSGRLSEAEATLQRALQLRPADATTQRLLGDLRRLQGQPAEATAAYRRAYELDSSQISVVLALREASQRAGEPAETLLPLLEDASTRNPNEPTLYLLLGDKWQQQGESERAITAYKTAIQTLTPERDGQNTNPQAVAATRAFASARLAESYAALARPEAALNYYYAAVAAYPSAGWTHVQLGDALRRADEPQLAEEAYRTAIAEEPAYLDGYVRLSDLLTAQGRTEEAEALYVAVEAQIALLDEPVEPVQFNAALPEPNVALSASDETTDSSVAGRLPFGGAGAAQSADLGRLNTLAAVYERQGKQNEALALFQQKLSESAPRPLSGALRARYSKGLADLHMAQGELPQAVAAYQQAVQLDAGWPTARLGLAQALALSGAEDAAVDQLEQAAMLAPGAVDVQLALADLLTQLGQVERARTLVTTLVQRQPGDPRALRAQAQMMIDQARWENADALYRRAIDLHPGDHEGYIAYAEFLIFRDRLDEADAQLRTALERDRRNGVVYLRLGDVALARGHNDEATAWYNEANTLVHNDQALESTLLDRRIEAGQYEEALASAESLLERYPASIELLRRTAQLHTRLGNHTEAESLLQRARALAPQNPRLASALGEALRAEDRLAEAQVAYEESIRLAPEESAYYLALSEIQVARANKLGALETLAQGAATVPSPEELVVARAQLQRALGDPDAAQATLQEAIISYGESVTLRLALAELAALNADAVTATDLYSRTLSIDPQNAAAHLGLGQVALEAGRTDEARAHFDAARAAPSPDVTSLLALASGYEQLDDQEQAAAVLQEVINLAPTLPQGYLRLAEHHRANDDPGAADAVFARALSVLPASGQLHLTYADFLTEQGDQEQAAQRVEMAVALSPTADTLIGRAAFHMAEGRYDEAMQDVHRALQQQPGAYQALITMGDLFREEGDRARAAQLYERAVAQQPGVAAGYLRLAGLAFDIGDVAEAERLQVAARQAEPTLAEAVVP